MSKEEFFSILINIDDITTKNLISNGVSKHYISKFVSENIIERVEKGKYIIKDLKSLYSYGVKLLKKGLVNESIKCFNKCLEIDNSHIQSYLRLMIAYIYIDNYYEALKYLDYLTNVKVIVGNERRYILYLLSNVVMLSDNYRNELDDINFLDIKYENFNDKNAYNENKIRSLCFYKNFSNAKFKEKQMSKYRYTSIYNEIHSLLINKADIIVKENDKIVLNLIKNNQYKEAREMFFEKMNTSKYNEYITKLLDEIILLNETNVPPKTVVVTADNVYEAIDGKNYSLAKTLCNQENLMSYLLNVICDKIKYLTNSQIEKRGNFSLNYFTKINQDNYFKVEEYINYIYKILLKKRGVYILDALDDETTNVLLQIISLYPDLKAFLINYNLEKRIVIRYCPKKQKVIDVEKNYTYASFLYEYKHYTECMELCLNIIHSNNPTIDAYVLLAHTYIKLGRPKDARDCFIVVYGLTSNFKYADIIIGLNGANSKDLFGFKKTKKK